MFSNIHGLRVGYLEGRPEQFETPTFRVRKQHVEIYRVTIKGCRNLNCARNFFMPPADMRDTQHCKTPESDRSFDKYSHMLATTQKRVKADENIENEQNCTVTGFMHVSAQGRIKIEVESENVIKCE